LAENIH